MNTNPPKSSVAGRAFDLVPLRLEALETLRDELRRGVHEQKPNWSPRIWEYLQNCEPKINVAAPWCAATQQFVTDVTAKLYGLANPLDGVALEAYVPSYVQWAKAKPGRIITAAEARPGDMIAFMFGDRFDHIAMLELPIVNGIVSTIDGNSNGAGSREGDKIVQKRRTYNAAKSALIRWDEGLIVQKPRRAIAA